MIPENIRKKIEDGVKRLGKESTAPDKETPDWMECDIRRGAEFGYNLALKEKEDEIDWLKKAANKHLKEEEFAKERWGNCLKDIKEKSDRIKELEDFVKQFLPDPYPEDIFTPVSSEELKQIHIMLKEKFGMPIDRLTGHIGRILRNPLREDAKQLLNK